MATWNLPTFPLTINIFRYSNYLGVLPIGLTPDVVGTGNLVPGRSSRRVGLTQPRLLVPFTLDVRASESFIFTRAVAPDPDLIQISSIPFEYWTVTHLFPSALGFSNEHQVCYLSQGIYVAPPAPPGAVSVAAVSGVLNGSNTSFSLGSAPSTLLLFRNGILMLEGTI